jgi:hypothetical protein
MYSGDSQSNLFQRIFLALLLGGEKVDKWAQQSFANPARRGQDWHIIAGQILHKNGRPKGETLLSKITLESHDVRVSRSAVQVCGDDLDAMGHAALHRAPELRSVEQDKRAPDLFLELDSKLHATHLGHPFVTRKPGLIPHLEKDLTACLRELSVAWPNAVVLGLTVPSICSQKYEGEYRDSLNGLWSGDAEGPIRTCTNSKLLLEEPLLTCAAGMSDERGARELHARMLSAMDALAVGEERRVSPIDYYLLTLGRCHLTAEGDGRHFPGAFPKILRLIMHHAQAIQSERSRGQGQQEYAHHGDATANTTSLPTQAEFDAAKAEQLAAYKRQRAIKERSKHRMGQPWLKRPSMAATRERE